MEWGAIIAGVLALVGTIVSSTVNYTSQNKTNKLQQDLAQQANEWQIQNRDFQNWYNSPTALAGRGLNPALAMSAAGSSLSMSADAGSANLPSDLSAPRINDLGTSISGIANQTALTNSQISLNEAQARRLDTQSDIDWHNLSNEQQRTLIMQQNADTVANEANAKIADLFNQMSNRDAHFSLEQDKFNWSKQVDEETLKQGWEKIHIDKENLRATLELLPYMSEEHRNLANMYAQQAVKAKNEAAILAINKKYEEMLQDVRENNKTLFEAAESGKIQQVAAEASQRSEEAIRGRSLAEKPFLYWLFKVGTGSGGANTISLVQLVSMMAK